MIGLEKRNKQVNIFKTAAQITAQLENPGKKDIDALYGPYPDSDDLIQPVIFDTIAPKPNVIIVYLDDLGYGDLSCFGSQAISMPNIDKMAEEGVWFTNYHSVSSVCAPSRAGLLTGRYPSDAPLTYKAQVKFVLPLFFVPIFKLV